ncbi:MAG: type II toxin-antitoxin system VapC family toxin [Saprospiraceae bacterium]|nr:type II toxin-antitoxin system VapC family toxin [Saprospiraceae bacterium]
MIDTNIALYLLSGDKSVEYILDNKNVYISFVTELELLGHFDITSSEQHYIESFLKDCIVIDLNQTIKLNTISIKQKYRMKLPDAIIAATSMYLNINLFSADKGFERVNDIQFIRYII